METQLQITRNPGSHIPAANAQRYGERLLELEVQYGALTPATIVKDAEQKSSPLHDWFEWRQQRAADEYRLVQARYLLRMLEVKIELGSGEQRQVRLFHHVRTADDGPTVYVKVQTVMAEQALLKQVLTQAAREARAWQRRYDTYAECASVINGEALGALEELAIVT